MSTDQILKIFNAISWPKRRTLKSYIDKAKNVGFSVYDQGVLTYEQNKLGLSDYYHKRYLLDDGIQTKPLDF